LVLIPSFLLSADHILDESEKCFIDLLYGDYSKLMFLQANRILENGNDVEDAVQQAWLNIIKYLPKLKLLNCDVLPLYIVTIVKHCAIDLIRKERGQRSIVFSDFFEGFEECIKDDCFETVIENLEMKDKIASAIQHLTEEDQFLLHSKYVMGWTNDEIADYLGVKSNSVRTIIYRIRKKVWEESRNV